ncbi:MAG: TrbC/VirB2 family protein [Pseudomonadales bacterium]|nr:TrbC/VirB2 family protein [Pseudomonadales bacterium]
MMKVHFKEISVLSVAVVAVVLAGIMPEFAFAADPAPLVDGAEKFLDLFSGNLAKSVVAIVIAIMGLMMFRGYIEGGRVIFTFVGISLLFFSQVMASWYLS